MGNFLDRVGRVGNVCIHSEISYNSPLNKARPEEGGMIGENEISGFSEVHLKGLRASEVCVGKHTHI